MIRNKTPIIIFGIVVLAIALRCVGLNRGFFGDEAVTLMSVSAKLPEIIPSLVKYDSHPPLTAILLHLWMQISDNEIFIRYYFILFGIGLLFLLYLIAKEYSGGNKNLALLVLFLGSISPMLISISQFVRNYIDSAFWILLSSYFFLLIIKDKSNKWVWLGYLISSIFSVYSFYFSFCVLLCQVIYIFIFYRNKQALIRKFAICQIAVFLVFLPWLPNLIRQFSNAGSSITHHWERFGFKFSGLDIGIYIRNIFSLFGADQYFMVYPQGIKEHFGMPLIILMVIIPAILLLLFLIYIVKYLNREFQGDRRFTWVLLFLSLAPVVLSWIISKILKTAPSTRYIAAQHAVFLIIIAYFFQALVQRHKKTGRLLFGLFVVFYLLRIPMAVAPLYDGKKVLDYLRGNLREGDCTVMVDRLPGRDGLSIPALNIENDLFFLDRSKSEYRYLPQKSRAKIKETLMPFKRIWFIRCYGNTEIFGGNSLVYNFLITCGKKEAFSKEFHNIKLILME